MVTTRSGRTTKPSTAQVERAVRAQVGTMTNMSLDKGHSRNLGAGMPTLVAMTKAQLRKKTPKTKNMLVNWSGSGIPTRRGTGYGSKRVYGPAKAPRTRRVASTTDLLMNWSGAGIPTRRGKGHGTKKGLGTPRRKSTTVRRRRSPELLMNWSGTGIPARRGRGSGVRKGQGARHLKKTTTKKPRKVVKKVSSGCNVTAACKPTPKGTLRVRNSTSCKCLAVGGAAARARGICGARYSKAGVMYETVPKVTVNPITGKRSTRCVKAGGAAAKERGTKGCGIGKVLKTYITQVPVYPGQKGSPMHSVTAQRCVKAVGQFKDCPANKVLARVPSSGRTPQGKVWAKNVKKCVLPSTAAKKGYNVISRGSLPVHTTLSNRRAGIYQRVAMSPGY